MNPQEAFEEADREYREAEALAARGVPLPYLVTLSFMNKEDAHRFIESIKTHDGVIVDQEYVTAIDAELRTVPASVVDLHPWSGKTEEGS